MVQAEQLIGQHYKNLNNCSANTIKTLKFDKLKVVKKRFSTRQLHSKMNLKHLLTKT